MASVYALAMECSTGWPEDHSEQLQQVRQGQQEGIFFNIPSSQLNPRHITIAGSMSTVTRLIIIIPKRHELVHAAAEMFRETAQVIIVFSRVTTSVAREARRW